MPSRKSNRANSRSRTKKLDAAPTSTTPSKTPTFAQTTSFLSRFIALVDCYKAFCQTQYSLIFKDFSNPGNGLKPSTMVGVSCFSFLLPILFCHIHMVPVWIFQTWISFFSDYLHAGKRSITHGIDRVVAITMVVHMTFTGAFHFPAEHKYLIPMLFFICTSFIVKSKEAGKAGNRSAFVFYHSMWHFLAGPVAAFIVFKTASIQ